MNGDSVVFEGLNAAQRDAVTTKDGPLLVLAGAGSGKTRVITHRIAWLISSGVAPEKILAVTFTNKAAREMRERTARLVGFIGPTVCTFHAFGARFLRSQAEAIGLRPEFTLFDRSDSEASLGICLDEAGLDRETYKPSALADAISAWKGDLVSPAAALDLATNGREERLAQIYAAYEAMMHRNCALDFDDLLSKTVGLLESRPDILEALNACFEYVLVDEYQDINRCQYRLSRLLAGPRANLCATGDPDQCIYSWRGASIDYILEFPSDFPGAKVVKLEQNYRSVMTVLRAASHVIRFNRRHGDKNLWSDRGEGPLIEIRRVSDDIDEGNAVAEHVRRLVAGGARRSDIAVFYRLNSLSYPVERAFIAARVPYQVLHGLEFFKRKEVKDVLAWLRFLSNPDDEVSLLRIINTPARGLGDRTLDQLLAAAHAGGTSLGRYLDDPHAATCLAKRATAALVVFRALLAELRGRIGDGVAHAIREIVTVSGLGDHLAAKAPAGSDPLGNIAQLEAAAWRFDSVPDRGGARGFLEEIALLSDTDTLEEEADKVVLMTLHSAKGLEFEHVVIVGMDKGVFPHVLAAGDSADEEEERRLFYVGLTRACTSVLLLTADARTRFGRTGFSAPSIFLSEIPEELTAVVDDVGFGRQSSMRTPTLVEVDDEITVRKGARVRHREFGEGTVVRIKGMGPDARVRVAFDDEGEREFVLRYARLEPVESW